MRGALIYNNSLSPNTRASCMEIYLSIRLRLTHMLVNGISSLAIWP